ncbi:MAG: hypothetical protein GX254_09670 [Clostridiales bacterium]|nr:hypothetical protein [Clostridiales bacterium]
MNNVDILSIVKVSNIYATKFYTELLSFLDNEDDYECYQVGINTRVNEDNGYFSNGVSYHIVILVKDNNEWGIGAMYSCPQELLPTNVYMPQGIGWGLITFISEPSTIDVMDENGTIHYNEDFTEFIVNATCNEVGNMGYSDDALKANIMAIKMCGWWAKAGRYREAIGCDIKFGDLI